MTDDDFRLETAACLWEAALMFRDIAAGMGVIGSRDHDPEFYDRVEAQFESHGTSGMRLYIMAGVDACIAAWRLVGEAVDEPSEPYDWSWCRGFVRFAFSWDGDRPEVEPKRVAVFGNMERMKEGLAPLDETAWSTARVEMAA